MVPGIPETRAAAVPGAKIAPEVSDDHNLAIAPLEQQGFTVRPKFSGKFDGGDLRLSEARQADDFLALSTTNHGNNVCTLKLDKPDTIALNVVANALRQKGFDGRSVQAATLPMHPPAANQYVGNRRFSPTYMTPSHGTISWSTDVSSARPNPATEIRSGIVRTNFRFAQRNDGTWTFDMQNFG
jgi:hypothetical protein